MLSKAGCWIDAHAVPRKRMVVRNVCLDNLDVVIDEDDTAIKSKAKPIPVRGVRGLAWGECDL